MGGDFMVFRLGRFMQATVGAFAALAVGMAIVTTMMGGVDCFDIGGALGCYVVTSTTDLVRQFIVVGVASFFIGLFVGLDK